MKNILLFLFSFALIPAAFSQTTEGLSKSSFDAIRDSINKYMFSDVQKSIGAAEAYILKGKREYNKEEEYMGMESIIWIHYSHRNLEEANEQFEKLLFFAKEHTKLKFEARAYIVAGAIQMSIPDLKEAIRYFNLSLQIAENEGDEISAQMALSNLSYVYKINGDYKKSLEIEKNILKIIANHPIDSNYTSSFKSRRLSDIHYNISKSYLELNKIDSAKHYSALIKSFNKDFDSCYLRQYYYSKYYISLEEKKYKKARKYLTNSEKYCPMIEGTLTSLRMALRYGNLASKEGDFEQASRKLMQGLIDYEVSPEEEGYMSNYYKVLAEAFKETGDFEKASYYFEKYLNTEKEHSKMSADVSSSLLEKERKKFKKDIEHIKAEKEKNQSHLNYLLLGGAVVILTLLFLLLKFYKNKKADEVKFEALLSKIKAANPASEIIDTKDELLEEKASSDLSEEVTKQILEGLKTLEEKEYFLKQECNSYNVAKKINTNTSYLSKVINSHYGKNFSTYINDLRINYAIIRLKNDVFFRCYSIQAIAEEVGYKSADSFTKYFKKDTGLNPSFYIKNIKNIT